MIESLNSIDLKRKIDAYKSDPILKHYNMQINLLISHAKYLTEI